MPDRGAAPFRSWLLRGWARLVRLMPKGRGVLFRLGWRLVGAPAKFVGDFDGLPFVVDPGDRYGSMHLFLWGQHEPAVTAVLLALLHPSACVIDVGSNRGHFSLLAAHRTRGRVISYEPLPRNFEFLRETRELAGLDHWLLLCIALSARDAPLAFDPRGREAGRSDWGAVSETGTMSVEARALDSELARLEIETVDVLKMDIEGHEIEAIAGMAGALAAKRIAHLIVELHPRAVGLDRLVALAKQMEDYGYHAYSIRESQSPHAGKTPAAPLEDNLEPLSSAHFEHDRPHVLWSSEALDAMCD